MVQMVQNLLSICDLSVKEIWQILSLAEKLKKQKSRPQLLKGKTLGLILEKPSTRTTVSFAVAIHQLGGLPLILNAQNLQRKRGETIKDTARTLSRYIDGIMIRAFHHADVEEFADWSTIPIINGLTDREHPCQILGDILTIIEKKKIKKYADFKKVKVVFVGDGNNVANSWILAASMLGFKFTLARPKKYGPDKNILEQAEKLAKDSGAEIEITDNPKNAVKNADVIYTDVWTSMGSESELEKRKYIFKPYQINKNLLSYAKKDCMVMHCLPAIRGEEITEDIIDGLDSIIFDQAENRLHIQKAILVHLMK